MERARTFLDHEVGVLWPAAVTEGGFRWDLLCGGSTPAPSGPDRLRGQYWRANVDPSDLYVQSLPGTDRYRMKPGTTGFDNLVVAGDWTDNGLNAGCVEAATRSGQQAAQAVAGMAGRADGWRDRPVSADGGDGRPGFTADAVEAARLAREVQDLGFDVARAIVDRFSDLFGQFCATAMSPMAGDRRARNRGPASVHLGADGDTYRRLQSDMRRSADSYLSVLSQLNDLSLRFFDVARPAGGSDGRERAARPSRLGPGVGPVPGCGSTTPRRRR